MSLRKYNHILNKVREDVFLYNIRLALGNVIKLVFLDKILKNEKMIAQDCVILKKAGRKYNYDFLLKSEHKSVKIELKYVSCIKTSRFYSLMPQIVSPMKTNGFFKSSYEEYFFTNYLQYITCKNVSLEDYLKSINQPYPYFLKEEQEEYYKGCAKSSKFTGEINCVNYYIHSKQVIADSIQDFISQNDIDIEYFTSYILKTQDKWFVIHDQFNIFRIQKFDKEWLDDYICQEKHKNHYKIVYKRASFKVLLRWKNGVAFPCLQVSILKK
jgi:hypothetical protein